jgi:cobalt-zinc-cadmium efflux system protein
VDVFFVVSGFVIARVVSRRQGEGQFSLIDFWERRTRRLLPAVLVVIAAATVMAMIHMFPDELVGFARSGLSTLAFSANLYFWQTIDYFAAPPDMHPLLHAWSLGVEEQFYIVFPLLMVLGWRWFPGRLRTVLACLALISFGAGVWMAKDMMSAGFYLPIGRAWELLLGVLLAQGAIPAPSDRRVRSLMGVVGLAVNVVSMWLLRADAADNMNMRGAYLEVVADAIGSVGVLVAALVMGLTGWYWVDPVVGAAIGLFIAPRAVRLGVDAVRVLAQMTPGHLDLDEVRSALIDIDGVVDVHDLHAWTLTSDMEVLTAHLSVRSVHDAQPVLRAAQTMLVERFRLEHATLQTEVGAGHGCEHLTW